MLLDNYSQKVTELFKRIDDTQRENIIIAGKMMADAMCAGQMIHIHDTGHIINFELINRSGGLAAPKSLVYYLHVDNDGRPREAQSKKDFNMEGMADLVVRASNICPGDLLIIGSVSGRSDQVVDLAITAKEKYNCKIIALTSLEYSRQIKSKHTSGLRLFEIADHVIDNCAPLGDGMLDVDDIPVSFAPASGLSATYEMWSVYCACLEEMKARGKTPSVLKSSNLPGGDDYNIEMEKRFCELGY